MKLADYVVEFLAERGVTHFFGMSGGAAIHFFDAVARNPRTSYVCGQHEQSSAMSADGYARASGKLGVAMTTSGPGATNLLTGVCCSYYDSIPTLMITGQVATHRLKGDRPVRQVGFQETDVVSIYQTVTKYVAQILDPAEIRYHLEKAFYLAFEGRPGPVILDIPDDLQRADVDPNSMRGFEPPAENAAPNLRELVKSLLTHAGQATRPALVLGGGLSTPRVDARLLQECVDALGFPILTTWAGTDLVSGDHPLRVGPFGVYGPRSGNFTVQNADFLLCIGTRLSQNVTGGMLRAFARHARIVMVDVDAGEMNKFDGRGITIHDRIQCRAEDFLGELRTQLPSFRRQDLSPWLAAIAGWRKAFSIDPSPPYAGEHSYVDAYDFVAELNHVFPEGETIYVDTGGNLTWTCNAVKLRPGQKLLSAWNNTPMGYALPASIGGCFAEGGRRNTCVIGDGGLMLCLGELATLVRHQLPIRVILFNNHCHGIQKQTLETWLDGRLEAVDPDSGLAFTDFVAVGRAMGLTVISIDSAKNMKSRLAEAYAVTGPVLINVEINPNQKLYPVVKFGFPLEEQLPFLDLSDQDLMLVPRYEHTGDAGVPSAGV